MGAGSLTLANSFQQTSIIFGTFLLIGTTFMTVLNLVFIVDSAQAANQFRYADLISENCPKWFTKLMLISLIIWPYGTCVAYGQIISSMFPPVIIAFGADPSSFAASNTCWLLIGGIVFFLLSLLRRLQ